MGHVIWDDVKELVRQNFMTTKDRVMVIEMLEHGKQAMLALESLTPQGSEYYNDIQACVKAVRGRRDRDMESIKRLVKANRAGGAVNN